MSDSSGLLLPSLFYLHAKIWIIMDSYRRHGQKRTTEWAEATFIMSFSYMYSKYPFSNESCWWIFMLSHIPLNIQYYTHIIFELWKLSLLFSAFLSSLILWMQKKFLYINSYYEKKRRSQNRNQEECGSGAEEGRVHISHVRKHIFEFMSENLLLKFVCSTNLDWTKKRLQQWSNIVNGHSLFCYEQKPATTKK